MSAEKSLREEHTQRTREALLEAAWLLFCRDGYEVTSLDVIAKQARVTKGAVYHHFASKKLLFGAVYERSALRLVEGMGALPIEGGLGTRERLSGLMANFLSCCRDPALRQVTFVDGPRVLGAAACREVDERYALGQLRLELGQWLGEGQEKFDLELLAHSVLALMIEFSAQVALAEDAEDAHQRALVIFGAFLKGLSLA